MVSTRSPGARPADRRAEEPRQLRKPFVDLLRARGLPPLRQVELLWLLAERHRTPGEVAGFLDIAPSTASQLLDRAEAAQLVEKMYLTVDNRHTYCRISKRGRALLKHIDLALAEARHVAVERSRMHVQPMGPYSRMERGISWLDDEE